MCLKPTIPGTSVEKQESSIQTDTTVTTEDNNNEHTFTIQDVTSNNTPSSAYCLYENKVLDITKFADRHPGGDIILLAAGKDATVLVRTYHPRGIPMRTINKLTVRLVVLVLIRVIGLLDYEFILCFLLLTAYHSPLLTI